MPARFELENLESRAQQTELTDSDMEDFQRTGDVVKLEDFQRAHFLRLCEGITHPTQHPHPNPNQTSACICACQLVWLIHSFSHLP